MTDNVFIIAEQQNDEFRKVTLEAISEGRRIADKLGSEVVVAVLGAGCKAETVELGKYGADIILMVDDAALSHYHTDAYMNVLGNLILEQNPILLILGATVIGKDLAGRLAARLDAGLAMDCIGINLDKDEFIFSRPLYGGKVIADVVIEGRPKIAAIRPNVMKISQCNRNAVVKSVSASIGKIRTTFIEDKLENGDRVNLTEADIIVSGGRGTKGDFGVIEELASLLKGAVGASRAAVDEGWRLHSDQVGQTGKVVSPKLYIACGISGAIQHLAGMSTSKYILSINKDSEAPIFKRSDYGIVGDLFGVIPKVINELEKLKQ